MAQELSKRFPLGTQVQWLWLPAIRAQLELNKKNPAAALAPHFLIPDTTRNWTSMMLARARARRALAKAIDRYCSFAYSTFAAMRAGRSGSASFQSVRNSL